MRALHVTNLGLIHGKPCGSLHPVWPKNKKISENLKIDNSIPQSHFKCWLAILDGEFGGDSAALTLTKCICLQIPY